MTYLVFLISDYILKLVRFSFFDRNAAILLRKKLKIKEDCFQYLGGEFNGENISLLIWEVLISF